MSSSVFQRIRILDYRYQPVRQLAGFEKRHRLPDSANRRSNDFVQSLASRDVDSDLDHVFDSIRKAFGFKRRDLEVHGPSDGGGTIVTPSFRYGVHVSVDQNDPSAICWRRELTGFQDVHSMMADQLEDVFDNSFSLLEIPQRQSVPIERVVDRIEEIRGDTVRIDYDKSLTQCTIVVAGCTAVIEAKADTIRFRETARVSPRQLVDSFLEIRRRLNTIREGNSDLFEGLEILSRSEYRG